MISNITQVWVSSSTGYRFYHNGARAVYRKTNNQGIAWGEEVSLRFSLKGSRTLFVWYDQWHPDRMGTLIHIVRGDDEFAEYRTLDTRTGAIRAQGIVRPGWLGTLLGEIMVGKHSEAKA